jgi:hypothetical protein
MSSTRKTPEHLKSAKNLRGVAEVAGAAGAEAAVAAVASEAAEVVEAALVAEVAAVSALAAEVAAVSALAAEVAEAAAAEDVASSKLVICMGYTPIPLPCTLAFDSRDGGSKVKTAWAKSSRTLAVSWARKNM